MSRAHCIRSHHCYSGELFAWLRGQETSDPGKNQTQYPLQGQKFRLVPILKGQLVLVYLMHVDSKSCWVSSYSGMAI
jgi:hypothetical protein